MRLLLLALLIPGWLFAEPAAERTCRILFLDAPDDAPEKLILFDGSKSQEVELPRMNLSRIYKLSSGAIRLHMLSSPVTDPLAIPAGAPLANLPESADGIYLILVHDPSNPVAPVQMQVVDASSDRLRSGQMRWFNLTPNAIGGIVGSEKLSMASNSQVTLKAPADGNTDYDVRLAYRIAGEEKYRPICETKWRHDPRSRFIVFVIGDTTNRSPRVMSFPDYRSAPPEKQ